MRLLALAFLLALPAMQEKKVSDADKKAAQQRYDAGAGLLAKGKTEEAIKSLLEAVKLDPGHAKAHEALARTYFAANNRIGAFDHVMALNYLGTPLSAEMKKIFNAVQTSVLAGVRWLIRHQGVDGRWSSDGFVAACRPGSACDGKGGTGTDLRSTCLALLALMGAGYSPISKEIYDQKPMGIAMKNGLMWLMKQQKAEGAIGDPASPRGLEDHALAALTLTEAYDMTAIALLKDPSQKSLDYLLTQRIPSKGWGAQTKAAEADPAATGWALFAVRSGKRAGLTMPSDASTMEASFVAAPSGFSAAVIAAGDDASLKRGLALQAIAGEEVAEDIKVRDSLKIFLSTVALLRGDPDTLGKKWSQSAKERLAKSQRYDAGGDGCIAGSWDSAGSAESGRGRVQTTSFNVLSLELMYSYQNVFCAPPVKK